MFLLADVPCSAAGTPIDHREPGAMQEIRGLRLQRRTTGDANDGTGHRYHRAKRCWQFLEMTVTRCCVVALVNVSGFGGLACLFDVTRVR